MEEAPRSYLLVFVGAGLGGVLRHGVNVLVPRWGVALSHGTLFVNVAGSLLAGLVSGYFAFRGEGTPLLRLFLMTGILGGFTTFSAFSVDVVLLFERGELAAAATYAVGSVVFSVAATLLGLWLARLVA